jgi:hypothetical protein
MAEFKGVLAKMRIPKCPKTTTGKHYWRMLEFYTAADNLPKLPRCGLCGMIDDRKKTGGQGK